ncbi:MAG TPA: hypothetical protein VK480_08130 [Solirubrobacterales bacterium]|nr:hypothetical protein [Solirubrobacterales bacterium]
MIGRRLLAIAATLLLALACAPPAAADPEPLRVANLRVWGGEENWHARNFFRLNWDQVPGPPAYPRAVVYRLFDPQGNPVGPPVRDTERVQSIEGLAVPSAPGAYAIEVWLEDAEGRAGPAARATLRFDDAVPPPPAPLAPDRWLSGHETAELEIGHPQGSPPVSGIRGYAVSLDGSAPCAAPICDDAEIDLPGGVADDTLELGTLPEGTTVARVAAVSGSGVASAAASAAFKVDGSAPQLSLSGLPGGWSDGPVQLTALATDPLSGMAADGPSGPFTAIAVDDSLPTRARGDRATAWALGSGVHTVAYFARDAAANGAEGWPGAPPPATATVRIDEGPPRVAFAPAQDPAEPERIEATVDDPLSGPSSDRGSIGVRPAGTGVRFQQLPTRVAGGRLIARWDSDAYPPGSYEFLATGFDIAGNAASSSSRRGGARMVLANPLKTPVRVESGFGRQQQARQSVAFGRGARFGGRLVSSSGAPLAGLELTVTESFAAGSRPAVRTTAVRTGGDGSFSVWLAPGPSRGVSASFAGSRTLTRAAGPSAQLAVRSSVRLRTSAATAEVGGAPVVFSGRVERAGGERPKGLPVELQFHYPGAGWSEFRSVEADARGRFRYAYRFSDDDSRGIRFQFRAHVKGREGWPYGPGTSRPVSVTGR